MTSSRGFGMKRAVAPTSAFPISAYFSLKADGADQMKLGLGLLKASTPPISQLGLKTPSPSSPFAISLKDFQEVLKEYNSEIIEEVKNARRIIVSEFLEQSMIRREAILSVFQGVNYKMEETIDNEEERQDVNMEELVTTDGIKEDSTILQNECLVELEKEKLQVYFKKFSIMDTFSNLEWDLQDGSEMEKFSKESSLKVLRRKESAFLFNMLSLEVLRRKEFAFLFHVLKFNVLRRKDFAFLFDFLKSQLLGGFFYFEVG